MAEVCAVVTGLRCKKVVSVHSGWMVNCRFPLKVTKPGTAKQTAVGAVHEYRIAVQAYSTVCKDFELLFFYRVQVKRFKRKKHQIICSNPSEGFSIVFIKHQITTVTKCFMMLGKDPAWMLGWQLWIPAFGKITCSHVLLLLRSQSGHSVF